MAEQKREPWNPLLCNYPDSERINRLSIGAETMYTRLLARSDDHANYWGTAKMLLSKLYALRHENGQVSTRKCQGWLNELVREKLAEIYQINGRLYLHLTNCKKYLRSDIKLDVRFPQPTPESILTAPVTSPDTSPDTRAYPATTTTTTDTDTTTTTKKAHSLFQPPTLQDIKNYIVENPKLKAIDPQVFFDAYSKSHPPWTDTQGKPVRNWKLKLHTWSRFAETKASPAKSSAELLAEFREQEKQHDRS